MCVLACPQVLGNERQRAGHRVKDRVKERESERKKEQQRKRPIKAKRDRQET